MRASERTEWPGDFGNWGRWSEPGGTINLITPEVVLRAVASVRTGKTYSCARELTSETFAPDAVELHGFQEPGYDHRMLSAHGDERFAAADRISMTLHSLHNTHLDGLSHVGHLGKGFNGIPVGDMVDMESASKKLAITDTPVIVTRGILVDVPRLRGIDFMTPGDWVTPEDLDSAANDILPGDALVVRTGRWKAPLMGPDTPGSSGNMYGDWAALHVDCLDWVAEHDLSLVGTDSTGDTFPTPTPNISVHIVAEVYLGLPLLHSMDLEAVAATCAAEDRSDFLLCVAPLNISGGTGSPAAPIVVM